MIISIQPIDGTLTITTTPGQSGPRNNGNESVLHIPPKLQNTQWCVCVCVCGDFNPLQRYSQHILQP